MKKLKEYGKWINLPRSVHPHKPNEGAKGRLVRKAIRTPLNTLQDLLATSALVHPWAMGNPALKKTHIGSQLVCQKASGRLHDQVKKYSLV